MSGDTMPDRVAEHFARLDGLRVALTAAGVDARQRAEESRQRARNQEEWAVRQTTRAAMDRGMAQARQIEREAAVWVAVAELVES
jgi:hypothetical protein